MRLHPIAALLIASTLSCGSPTEKPIVDPEEIWTISLVQQQRIELNGPSCVKPTSLYCHTVYPDSTELTAKLHRQSGKWTLDNTTLGGPFTGILNSDGVTLWLQESPTQYYCLGVVIQLSTPVADSIAGTYIRQTDCHGTGTSGRLSGRR